MTYSLQLSDDVIEVRDWVHQFAAEVVRPAAAEWDEREETPWPVIQEASKVGLFLHYCYSCLKTWRINPGN